MNRRSPIPTNKMLTTGMEDTITDEKASVGSVMTTSTSKTTATPSKSSRHSNNNDDEILAIKGLLDEAVCRLNQVVSSSSSSSLSARDLEPSKGSSLSSPSFASPSQSFHAAREVYGTPPNEEGEQPPSSLLSSPPKEKLSELAHRMFLSEFQDQDAADNKKADKQQVVNILRSLLDYKGTAHAPNCIPTQDIVEHLIDNVMSSSAADQALPMDLKAFLEMMDRAWSHHLDPTISTNTILDLDKSSQDSSSSSQRDKKLGTPGKKIDGKRKLFDPTGRFSCFWSVILTLAVGAVVVVAPLMYGWGERIIPHLLPINLTIDIIFMLDVIKSFFTASFEECDGANVVINMNASKSRRAYLKKYFAVDVLSSIPVDLIFVLAGAESQASHHAARHPLKMLSFFRVFKILACGRYSRVMARLKNMALRVEDRLGMHMSNGFLALLRLITISFFLAHWTACLQFRLVRMNDFPSDSWVVMAGLDERNVFEQWQWSYFKALAQMILIGFETPPFTNASCNTMSKWCQKEHWATLMMGLFPGAVFFSLLIANIHSISETHNHPGRRYEERMRSLDGFLRREQVPQCTRMLIKHAFQQNHPDRAYYHEDEVSQDVDSHRMQRIRWNRVSELGNRCHKLFNKNETTRHFLHKLSAVVERVVYYDHEELFSEYSHGEYVFFLTSGMVDFCRSSADADNTCFHIATPGSYFGFEKNKFSFAARARSECAVFRVCAEEWKAITMVCPDLDPTWNKAVDELSTRNQSPAK